LRKRKNKRGAIVLSSLSYPNINIKEKKDKVGQIMMAQMSLILTFLIIIYRGTYKERNTREKDNFSKRKREKDRKESDILRTLLAGSVLFVDSNFLTF